MVGTVNLLLAICLILGYCMVALLRDARKARRRADEYQTYHENVGLTLLKWNSVEHMRQIAQWHYDAYPDRWTHFSPIVVGARLDLPDRPHALFVLKQDGRLDQYIDPSHIVALADGTICDAKHCLDLLRAYDALAGDD